MSRKTINEILGLASVNRAFRRELLANPLKAVQARGFNLTAQEEAIFEQISARDLTEFSQILLAHLDPKERE